MTNDTSTNLGSWTASAVAGLLETQADDGGWPYHVGQAASTEPTALAMLALSVSNSQAEASASANWLIARQREDGFFTASPTHQHGSWITPLAAMALDGQGWTSAGQSAMQALLSAEVYTTTPIQPGVYGYDTTIPGWPWTIGGFSFVEPTALAMIFLKRAGYASSQRVEQGARFLRDRALNAGGWNYGEPQVLGGDLFPTVVPTALALLALADEPDDKTAAGVNWLLGQHGKVSSLFSLGWAAVALNVLGLLDDSWRTEVIERWNELPAGRRGPMETSLCLLGLISSLDHPFAVS